MVNFGWRAELETQIWLIIFLVVLAAGLEVDLEVGELSSWFLMPPAADPIQDLLSPEDKLRVNVRVVKVVIDGPNGY